MMKLTYRLRDLRDVVFVYSVLFRVYCEKTAEAIEMPFRVVGQLGPRNRVLDGRAHRRHLAHTVERSSTRIFPFGYRLW